MDFDRHRELVSDALTEWEREHGPMNPESKMVALGWFARGLELGFRLGVSDGHDERVDMIHQALRIRRDGPVLTLVT